RRNLRLQGSLRGIRKHPGRAGVGEAGFVLRTFAGDREQSSGRSAIPKCQIGSFIPDPRCEPGLLSLLWKSCRADRSLQPPEGRPCDSAEGKQARDAEERAGGEVPKRAAAD